MADHQSDGNSQVQRADSAQTAANQASAAAPSDALPAEYYRADEELLERTIELTEPYDPENTIET